MAYVFYGANIILALRELRKDGFTVERTGDRGRQMPFLLLDRTSVSGRYVCTRVDGYYLRGAF